MVTAPLVLLVAVTSNPSGVAMARDAATACLESMPAGAKSVVRTAPVAPPDAEVAGAASASGAAAVVVLTWHDPSLLTTDVRIFVVAPEDRVSHWVTRTIVFSARDLPSERGRALGLVIASALDESWGVAPAEARASPAPSPSGEVQRWALEANVTTAIESLGDVDDTIGGTIGVRRSLSGPWALRAGLGFRVADIDGANATARTVLGAVGIAWTRSLDRPQAFGFGARFDVLGVHEALKRGDGDDAGDHVEGWSIGADLLAQGGYGLSQGTTLIMGVGVEGTLTEVGLGTVGRPAATIPHTQLVLELGVLSRF
jgi:hypothetical protein